jgi:hypothetical protein
MKMRRLMICTTVGLCALSVAAFAADRSRKNPFKSTPLAAPHHGSITTGSKKISVRAAKPEKTAPKNHFWNR